MTLIKALQVKATNNELLLQRIGQTKVAIVERGGLVTDIKTASFENDHRALVFYQIDGEAPPLSMP